MNVTIGGAGSIAVPVVSSAGSGLQRKFPPCVDRSRGSSVASTGGFAGRIPDVGLKPCRASDLTITDGSYNEIEERDNPSEGMQRVADMWLGRTDKPGCTLTQWTAVRVTDGNGLDVPVKITIDDDASFPARHETHVFGPSDAYERVFWKNWCGGRRPGPLRVLFELPDGLGTIRWIVRGSLDANGDLISPPCIDPKQPSELSVRKTL